MFYKLILIVAIFFNVGAQLLLKTGMKSITLQESYLTFGKEMISSYYFWGALVFYGSGFILYAAALSKFDLSKAYPISSVIAIVLTVLVSVIFLSEPVTPQKFIGIILCIAGVLIIFK